MAGEETEGLPADLDPAAPASGEESVVMDAVAAANRGLDDGGAVEDAAPGAGPHGQPATITVHIQAALDFLRACETSAPRVVYGLGSKVRPGQVPGRDFKSVDCSGFVREAIRRSTELGGSFPDGSVVQHEWVRSHGFALAAAPTPAPVYIAFLSPSDAPSGIGHVVLIYQGKTLESHGGVGPDSRPWNRQGWQAKATVYLLDSNPVTIA